ncbi:MAG: extracellular metalloproteinase, partial [bacterium]|nr:extracellular metalloproteinase [bacterium]
MSIFINAGLFWNQAYALVKPKEKIKPLSNYDIRTDGKADFGKTISALEADRKSAVSSLQKELGRDIVVKFNANSKIPHHLFSYTGTLTNPKSGDAKTIAQDFIVNHTDLFGIDYKDTNDYQVTRNYQTEHNGITHLTYQQFYQGVEVFNSEIRVNVANNGAIISASANHNPGLTGSIIPKLSATEVVTIGTKYTGTKSTFIPEIKNIAQSPNQKTIFASGPFAEEIPTDLVIFPIGADSKLAWRMIFAEKETANVYLILIDAETGDLLYRQNLTRYAAYGQVYEESPIAVTPPFSNSRVIKLFDGTAVSLTTTASPNGWVTSTTSEGNNVRAEEDQDGNNSTLGKVASDPSGAFDFAVDLFQDPTTYQAAVLTNLFWLNNMMHDWLYDLGFTESAGNFQLNNFGRGGLGNDNVTAQAQDGAGTNNANFYTPADGSKPRMQMYLWTYSSPRRDSSLDGDVVVHEYCHGLSNRLVGVYALDGDQSGGMGEGWSDWYAITLYDDMPANMNNSAVVGKYSYNNSGGIRRYPYSINTAVNPLTYGDLVGQVHDDGEIWCVTLWEFYKRLVQKYGLDADTTQPWRVEAPYDGRERAWLLVTDAMKLSPDSPTMLDMRDAILLADQNNFAGANKELIWQVFAKRGMGYSAISNGDTMSVTEAFDLPPNTPVLQYAGHQIVESQGNNDGKADAGEKIIMPVSLKNRGIYEATNITATLTCSSPFITITRNTGTYPNINVGTTQTVNSP